MRDRRTSGLPRPLGEALKPSVDRVREERLWTQIRARRANGLGGHSEPPRAGQYLPAPVSRVLKSDDSVSERSRLWRGIRARQHQADKARSTARTFKLPALGFGLAVAMAALLVFTGLVPLSPQVAAPAAQPKPLMLAGGAPVRTVDATVAAKVLKLTDASEIRLAKGAQLEPLLSSGSRFELLLRQGSAEFSVTPGGPRRWVIEAGLATVEVVGTVFRVNRSQHGVEVSVTHGTVIVRGEGVPDHVQRLTAGHSIAVVQKPVAVAPIPVAAPVAPVAAPAPERTLELGEIKLTAPPEAHAVSMARQTLNAPAHEAAWRGHLEQGEFATAYAALGDKGLLREVMHTDDPQRLLELADVARLSGHPGAAVKPLDRLIALHADSPHAALAAFTLGRVYLDQLKQPADAAKAFEQVIGMHPPHALLADCHTRLVEAYARAGDLESAERAAARYRTLFPTGRQLSDLSVWTQP